MDIIGGDVGSCNHASTAPIKRRVLPSNYHRLDRSRRSGQSRRLGEKIGDAKRRLMAKCRTLCTGHGLPRTRRNGPLCGGKSRGRLFYKLIELADVTRFRFHAIRRTFAGLLLSILALVLLDTATAGYRPVSGVSFALAAMIRTMSSADSPCSTSVRFKSFSDRTL